MAKQRKSKPSTQGAPEETNAVPVVGAEQHTQTVTGTTAAQHKTNNQTTTQQAILQTSLTQNPLISPAVALKVPRRKPARVSFDEYDEEDDDEDDYDYDEDDYDEEHAAHDPYEKAEESFALEPQGVANDNPDVLAIFRTGVKNNSAPFLLSDYVRDRDDPRADVINELTAPLISLPAAPQPWIERFPLATSSQWFVELQYSRVVATAYPGTELARRLGRYGTRTTAVRVPARTRTAETIRAAAERCRLRLLLRLFDLEEADLKPARGGPLVSRANQLVRSLRRGRLRAVPHVRDAIAGKAELGKAVLEALAVKVRDHELWELLMEAVKPDWRLDVLLAISK
ncbi:MAG: hypothetical protein C0467_30885 [Planctomycetaceae bacterium]|nr:hypothetical protein [Planctomycetaceae bacterium]